MRTDIAQNPAFETSAGSGNCFVYITRTSACHFGDDFAGCGIGHGNARAALAFDPSSVDEICPKGSNLLFHFGLTPLCDHTIYRSRGHT